MRELKSPPIFWIGPELAKRTVSGYSPVLTDKQLREANSCGGLNLVVWEGCLRPDFVKNSELHRSTMNTFVGEHRGYLWKEAISSQVECVERLAYV